MRLINFILLLVSCQLAFGQITFTTNPTGKHQQYANYAQYARGKYGQLKAIKKDSVNAIKTDTSLTHREKRQRIKAMKQRWKVEKKKRQEVVENRMENRLGHELPDSIAYPPRTPDDSLKWAMQVLASSGQYDEIIQLYDQYQLVDSTSTLGLAASERAAAIAESFIPAEMKSELTQEVPQLAPGQMLMSDIPEAQLPHIKMEGLAQKMPAANMDQAVQSVNNLKKKYSELPDITNLKGGVKKNSLKGKGLAKRFVLGGNVSITSTDPLVVDVNLQLGYRINKKWTSGVGLQWRECFEKQDSLAANQDAHGYAVFSSYTLFKNIFGYGEYGAVQKQPLFGAASSAESTSHWQYQYLLGIGSEISLFKTANVRIILAYDFNHRNTDLNARPLVVRMGFSLNGLPGKK